MLSFDHGKENLVAKNRFIKCFPNEKTNWLARKHPNAFILLYFIAQRARRTPGDPDGLEVGEAHIGDWESYGMSEQNYRTAKNTLCKAGILKIIETNRTRKKSTTGVTTDGTKVKLLNSDIWDINPEEVNDRHNDCLTTDQRLANDEQECKEDKNDKKEHSFKPAFAGKKKSSSFSKEVTETVHALIDLLKKAKSDYKSASFETIAKSLDALIRIDDRKPSRILEIVSWAINDSFWRPYILKPNPGVSLRKNFDLLDEKAKSISQSKNRFEIWKKFENGNNYSGYEFSFSGDKICFIRTTATSHKEYSLRLNDPNLESNFFSLLNSLNIEIPKN